LARVSALGLWLVVVAGAPLSTSALYGWTAAPDTPAIPLSELASNRSGQVVSLPAGTVLPLRVDLDSPLLRADKSAGLPLSLSVPMEVSLRNGRPDGRYRLADGPWRHVSEGLLALRIDRLTPQLEQGQPVIRAHAVFAGNELSEDLP